MVGRASAAPRAQRAALQAARGGARPRGGRGDLVVGGDSVCACAAGPAPLLSSGRPRRRVNGGLSGSGLGGGGGGSGRRLGQPRSGRKLSGRRKALSRCGLSIGFSIGIGFGIVARGGRRRGAGAAGALRRLPGASAARKGAASTALLALGLQRLPRPPSSLRRQQQHGGRRHDKRWSRCGLSCVQAAMLLQRYCGELLYARQWQQGCH